MNIILQPRSALTGIVGQRSALILKFLPTFPLNLVGAGLVKVNYVLGNLEVRVDLGDIVLGLGASFQPNNSDLTAISALAGTGIAVRTAASTWALRTLTAPAAGITITNPAGIAGDMTLALANDLAALEALAGTGLAARTAAETWAQRAITGTAAEITVTNGDGVAGNPTLSLPAALTFTGKTVTGGTYASPIITGNEDVQGAIQLSGDISPAALGATTNDWAPAGLSTATTIRASSSVASTDITGLTGGADGRLMIVHNVGASNNLVLKDEAVGSTAANRFALTTDVTLTPDSVALLQYDTTSSRWRNIGGSGSGGGASTGEPFVTIGNTGGLSSERALTAGTGITLTDGGANTTVTLARGSGGRILLNTLTAAGSASLADTTSFTGTYKRYEIVFEALIHATAAGNFRFRYNQGGVQTTGYKARGIRITTSSVLTTEIPLTSGGTGETTAPGFSGTLTIDDPSTSAKHMSYGVGGHNDSSAGALTAVNTQYMGWFDTAGVVTGFEVTSSTGNITSGVIKVYGIVN